MRVFEENQREREREREKVNFFAQVLVCKVSSVLGKVHAKAALRYQLFFLFRFFFFYRVIRVYFVLPWMRRRSSVEATKSIRRELQQHCKSSQNQHSRILFQALAVRDEKQKKNKKAFRYFRFIFNFF